MDPEEGGQRLFRAFGVFDFLIAVNAVEHDYQRLIRCFPEDLIYRPTEL
jgi:hypothetical protein